MPKRDIPSVNWEDVKAVHNVPPEGEATSAPPEKKAEAPKAEEPKPEAKTDKKEEAKVEEPKPEDKKPDPQTPPVDYEKQLAEYKKRAEEAEAKANREKAIREGEREKAKQLARKLKKNEPDGLGEPDGDDPILPEQVETIAEKKAREQIDSFKQEQANEIITEELQALSDNPTERELIKVIYETELNPNGRTTRAAIRQGLENARFLANRERYAFEAEQRAKEKIRKDDAQKAAMQSVGGSGGSQGRPEPSTTPAYSPQEMKLLRLVGKDKADGD